MLHGLRWMILGVWALAGMSGYSASDVTLAAIAAHRMHADLLEAAEEALSYSVLNDIGEKKDYQKKMDDFDSRAADFRECAHLDEPENGRLNKKFQDICLAKLEIAKAIEKIIAKFEENKSLKKEDVAPVQQQVRAASRLLEELVALSVKSLNTDDDPMLVRVLDSLKMEADMLEAIACAYAYVSTRDAAQKEAFYTKTKDCDEQSDGFITRTGIAKLGNEAGMQSYNQFTAEKDNVEKAATAMFRKLDVELDFNVDLTSRFEIAVDRFTKYADGWLAKNIAAMNGNSE